MRSASQFGRQNTKSYSLNEIWLKEGHGMNRVPIDSEVKLENQTFPMLLSVAE
jgi:hypothetical protein